MQVPEHAPSQQTPSTQIPPWQSLPLWHFFPWAQRAQVVVPPQSTSVSVPSCLPSSQATVPPQPSGMVPQVTPAALQSALVFGVQPHTPGVPGAPPPHVSGAVHWLFIVQPVQLPLPSQTSAFPQAVPWGLGVVRGAPIEQVPAAQSAPAGRSVSSAMEWVPPAPSHTTFWQSPGVCVVITVPAGASAVPHRPWVQVRTTHSVPGSGQSVGEAQASPASTVVVLVVLVVIAVAAPPAPPLPNSS
jgi:hypothetical protein